MDWITSFILEPRISVTCRLWDPESTLSAACGDIIVSPSGQCTRLLGCDEVQAEGLGPEPGLGAWAPLLVRDTTL